MAGTSDKNRSSNNDDAEKLINVYSGVSRIVYKYVYLKRVGIVYDALLCRDENDCDSLVIHGISIGFESISRSELGDEAVINGRSAIYYYWDPCRSRRYLVLLIDQERGGDLDG
jgi:hypothetical protein